MAEKSTIRVLTWLTEITLGSVTIASGSTSSQSGSATNSYVTDFNATDSDGDSIYYFCVTLYELGWCTAGSYSLSASGNTLTLTATLANPSSASHTCSAKYRILVFSSTKAIAEGF